MHGGTCVTWELWLAFVVTEGLLCVTPGPAVLMVIAQGLTRGVPAGLSATLGVLAGNTFYFVLSATSLGALIAASHEMFLVVKWLGAAYLIWLGIAAFRGRSSPLSVNPARPARLLRVFANGAALQLANPKALLFFVALLPQFIDPAEPVMPQIFILGVTSVVLEFLALLAYSVAASRCRVVVTQSRFVRLTDRIAGSCLIGAGLLTAAIRRD
jgi:homoserine/homoserine lactone efflux protein